MGVEFDLVYRNNKRIPLYGACFGCLNLGEYPDGYIRHHTNLPYAFEGMTPTQIKNQCREQWREGFENVHFLQWHIRSVSGNWNGAANYCEAMKELINDIPWMTGVSVHSLLNVVRVDMNQPADKVMMTLFLLRNLCHYEHYISTYKNLRETHNFKPYAAAILSSLFVREGGTPFSQPSWKYNSVGEYNWLSPFTFGVQALGRMLTEGVSYNPWFQENFLTAGQYRRDSWFRDENIEFNGASPDGAETLSRYRRLIDCMSIPNDTPLFTETQLHDNGRGYGRRYYWHMNQTFRDPAPIIGQFIAHCLSFGYNPIAE